MSSIKEKIDKLKQRRTGQTYSMLHKALSLSKLENKTIFIISDNKNTSYYLKIMFIQIANEFGYKIENTTEDTVMIGSYVYKFSYINMENLTLSNNYLFGLLDSYYFYDHSIFLHFIEKIEAL